MNKLQRFLWWCAGAHLEILQKYPTEWGKYFGIGGTIIFTALMASFAGGYAFFTAFKDVWLSIGFGIFWGALIFNLDRYIVSSLGKGDGTTKITKEEFYNAFPRIVLAILIGFVVSTPLELKVFEREIEVEIQEIINEKRQKMLSGLNDLRGMQTSLKSRIEQLKTSEKSIGEDIKGADPRIQVSNEKIAILKKEEETFQNRLLNNQEKQRKLSTEIVYLEDRTISGDKTILKKQQALKGLEQEESSLKSSLSRIRQEVNGENDAISEVKDNLRAEYSKTRSANSNDIESLNKQIADLDTIIQSKAKGFKDQSEKYNGFMARLEALDRLSHESDTIYALVSISSILPDSSKTTAISPQRQISKIEESFTVVWYAKWMIALLLIAIEIAPILFKMMTESGPYDDRIEEIKYASEVEKKKYISDINQKINTELKISNQLNEQKLEAELKANQELLRMIASSQSEIISEAIKKWKANELKKAEEYPESFIRSNEVGGIV